MYILYNCHNVIAFRYTQENCIVYKCASQFWRVNSLKFVLLFHLLILIICNNHLAPYSSIRTRVTARPKTHCHQPGLINKKSVFLARGFGEVSARRYLLCVSLLDIYFVVKNLTDLCLITYIKKPNIVTLSIIYSLFGSYFGSMKYMIGLTISNYNAFHIIDWRAREGSNL